MDKLKTILTLIAIIVAALVVLSAIGFIYTILGYVMILGVVCLAGFIAFKLLSGSGKNELPPAKANRELKKVERILEEYKRK